MHGWSGSLINVPYGAYLDHCYAWNLQTHFLRVFVTNLKNDAIYGFNPESFATKILLSGKFSPFLTLIIVLWSSCLWVTEGWKKPNLQKSTVGYHFGASWKAVMTQSLTFEQRQIEGRSWWQNWPFLCALQLCCWAEDLKTHSLGSTPAIMKM